MQESKLVSPQGHNIRTKLFLALFLGAVWLSQSAFIINAGRGGLASGGGVVTIIGGSLASNSFAAPSTSNQDLGLISIQTTGGAFTGTLSAPGGTDGALYQVVGSNLKTVGVICASPPCTHHITITPTMTGAVNSGVPIAFTISGNAPGILNTSITLVNDGGSGTTAGTPTPTFGQLFNDGELCSGSAPVFKISGVTQPFSASPANARRYWPSGCLMFASFMLRPTVTVAASGSTTVAITGGGSWPSASSRTTTELYAQNLVFNAPAATVTTVPDATIQNKVTRGSWLKGDSNNYQQDTWLDGDAGKCWRVKTKMAATQGGTADATLRFNHYVCAINNASGTLGGFRWLGQMRNPVMDGASPPKAFWFLGPNNATPASGTGWTVCQSVGGCIAPAGAVSGATPIYMPYAQSMSTTVTSGSSRCGWPNVIHSSTPTNFYTGAGNLNVVPVYNTTSSRALFASQIGSNDFDLFTGASGGPAGGCGGTVVDPTGQDGTYVPAVFIDAYNRVNVATKDAQYNFFQGTGSIAAETTLRVRINQTYWQSSKVFYSFDLQYQGINNPDTCGKGSGCINTVAEAAAGGGGAWTYDWSPYSIGSSDYSSNDTGDHDDIGMMMLSGFADFYNQTALSEKVVRINGLSSGIMTMADLKDGATDNIPLFDVSTTYTGIPGGNSAAINWCWQSPQGTLNFNGPTSALQQPISLLRSFDHKSSMNLPWAYARTGELQYLDMMVDQFSLTYFKLCADRFPNPALGNPYAVISTAFSGGQFNEGASQLRYMAWSGVREEQYAALFYPFDPSNPTNTSFDGTQTGFYLNNVADQSARYPMERFTSACSAIYGSACSYVTAASRWSGNSGTVLQRDGPMWQIMYVAGGMAVATIRHLGDSTTAGNFARQFMTTLGSRLKYEATHFGYYHLYHYYAKYGTWVPGAAQHYAQAYYSDDDHYAISQANVQCQIGSDPTPTAGRYFSLIGDCAGNASGWRPDNCDVIMNWGLGFVTPQVGLADDTVYYITQMSGGGLPAATFNLTTDKANCNGTPGSVVVPPGPASNGFAWDYRVSLANLAKPAIQYGWPYDINYPQNLHAYTAWFQALGFDSSGGFAGVVADAAVRLTNNPYWLGGCPCSFGDARYLWQDHFGP